MNPRCDKPGCGLPLVMGRYAALPLNWSCPRNADAHTLCARNAELEAVLADLAKLVEGDPSAKAKIISTTIDTVLKRWL